MTYNEALSELKSSLKFLELSRDYSFGDFKIPKGLSIPISEETVSKLGSDEIGLNILDIIQNMLMCTALCDDLPLNQDYEDLLSDFFFDIDISILESLLDVSRIQSTLKRIGIVKGFSERSGRAKDFILSAKLFIGFYQNNNDELCLDYAEKALYDALSSGDNSEAYYLLSYIFDRKSERVNAYEYALKSLESSPSPELKTAVESGMEYLVSLKDIEIAQSLMNDGNFDSAVKILKTVETEDDWERNLLLGESYTAMEDSKSALPYLKKALDLNPTEPRIYSSIGLAAFMAGDISNSLRFFENGLKLQPLNLDIMKNLALLYSRTGKTQVALKLMYKARDLNPDDIEILDIISHISEKMDS